jgi:hypothetical protein|tara:strand:+ start:81 stop:752 length:672 start_codon:yes stop_codon:yes gene_type:complete
MAKVRETIVIKQEDKQVLDNSASREEWRTNINSLNVTTTNNPVQELKKRDNVVTLGEGEHGGMKLTKPTTKITSNTGATIARQVVIEKDGTETPSAMFNGVTFISSKSNPSRNNSSILINIKSGYAVFNGCTFIKDASDPLDNDGTGCYIAVQEGAKAAFSGCVWATDTSTKLVDAAATGDLVFNHAGNDKFDTIIIGGVNETGLSNIDGFNNVFFMFPLEIL